MLNQFKDFYFFAIRLPNTMQLNNSERFLF